VNLLDENIPASQRQLLENWRIRPRQIGFNIGRRGLQDAEIIVFLQQLRRPTFFTRDDDFYEKQLVHAKYALVYLAVEKHEVAHFVRRLLRHPAFDTQAKRVGAVIRASSAGLAVWRLHAPMETHLDWTTSKS
jgi:hypothetical protein